jgi:NAD-dependent dihydropyrimidine dehydrogenase PreA subunit
MSNSDAYDKLADMMCTEDFRTGPGMKTPEFIEILQIQYTPEEAQLAVEVGFSGGKLVELAERTGIEKETLKKKLNTMADKGTIWIDPGSEDPNYRAMLVEGPGIAETAAWGDKFPWTEELKKRWNKYKYVWVREGITPAGPVVPVWAAVAALPPDALPSENINEVLKQLGYWSVSNCPCRSFPRFDESDTHCDHLLETCMNLGDIGRWAVEHGHAREITYEEAIDLLGKCEEDGLVHVGALPDYGILCNCCSDACANIIGLKMGLPHAMVPGPFVAVCDEETCAACMTCADHCPVDAIQVDDVAVVDTSTCVGCGVCVVGCDTESMRLERRPEAADTED